VVTNVTAAPETDPARIRTLLVAQITGVVRWRESVAAMAAQGVTEIWELGAGKALTGMVRRIDRSSLATAIIATPADITAARAAAQE
jgi:[acyl-carrier-protein] S-malonyltransferase